MTYRRRLFDGLLSCLLVLVVVAACAASASAATGVCATVETDPTPSAGDGADDAAIWINPANPAASTIIGADKQTGGGLTVYDLSGRQIQFIPNNRVNNVDIRYNFPLGGQRVTLVGATNRDNRRIDFYTVNEADRTLNPAGSVPVFLNKTNRIARGFAMYHSPKSGKYYAFVTDSGHTDQVELDGSSGQVKGQTVRQFAVSAVTEGLVADDEYARLYIGVEDVGGVMRFGAEPGDAGTGVWIDRSTEAGGHIPQDVKGLSMYYARNGDGYIIAASQGGDEFHVFNRGDNAWRGAFAIKDCPQLGTDKVTAIDGQDVTNANLGPRFPEGVFVTQDDQNPGFNQNYKLVPWGDIARPMGLVIDTAFNPRGIGGAGVGPIVQPPPAAKPPVQQPKPPVQAIDYPSPQPGGGGGGGNDGTTPITAAFGARPGVRADIPGRRALRATRAWSVRFVVRNANAFRVTGTALLETSGGKRLAKSVRFTVASKKTVSLRLTKSARKLLRRKTRKVELELRLRDPKGNARGVWKTFKLAGPKR